MRCDAGAGVPHRHARRRPYHDGLRLAVSDRRSRVDADRGGGGGERGENGGSERRGCRETVRNRMSWLAKRDRGAPQRPAWACRYCCAKSTNDVSIALSKVASCEAIRRRALNQSKSLRMA